MLCSHIVYKDISHLRVVILSVCVNHPYLRLHKNISYMDI